MVETVGNHNSIVHVEYSDHGYAKVESLFQPLAPSPYFLRADAMENDGLCAAKATKRSIPPFAKSLRSPFQMPTKLCHQSSVDQFKNTLRFVDKPRDDKNKLIRAYANFLRGLEERNISIGRFMKMDFSRKKEITDGISNRTEIPNSHVLAHAFPFNPDLIALAKFARNSPSSAVGCSRSLSNAELIDKFSRTNMI